MSMRSKPTRGTAGAQAPRPRRPSDAGAAAVELALVLPFLVLILFGLIQFGIIYNRVQGLHAAAREGARIASVGATTSQIQARVQAAQSLFTSSDVNVSTTPSVAAGSSPCATAGVGNPVTVVATVAANPQYAISIPLFGTYQISYSSTAIFRCERAGS